MPIQFLLNDSSTKDIEQENEISIFELASFLAWLHNLLSYYHQVQTFD